VLALDVSLSVAVVPVEVVERPAALLNDPDAKRVVALDPPAERVPVVDLQLPTDVSGMFA